MAINYTLAQQSGMVSRKQNIHSSLADTFTFYTLYEDVGNNERH